MDTGSNRTATALPDEVALRVRVEAVWRAEQKNVHERLAPLMAELQAARPRAIHVIILIMLAGFGLVLAAWPVALLGQAPAWFANGLAPGTLSVSALTAGILSVFGFWLYQYWQVYQRFVLAQNEQLLPLLGEVFHYPTVHHRVGIGEPVSAHAVVQAVSGSRILLHETVATLVQLSGLYEDPAILYETDDALELLVDGRSLVVAELRLKIDDPSKQSEINRWYNQSAGNTVFSGLFVHYVLERPLTGETYISSEGDRRGFAHRTFWNALTGMSEVRETLLESNAFERELHVASSDPIEARYILTPDFMEHLHEWWQEHRQNVRIAFKGQEFFMLLPVAHIKLHATPRSLTDEVVIEYLYTLTRPVWRTLRLIEEIRL